MKPSTCFSIGY